MHLLIIVQGKSYFTCYISHLENQNQSILVKENLYKTCHCAFLKQVKPHIGNFAKLRKFDRQEAQWGEIFSEIKSSFFKKSPFLPGHHSKIDLLLLSRPVNLHPLFLF
jgi:hypothetical protein